MNKFELGQVMMTAEVTAEFKENKEFRKESDKVAGLTGELVRGARDIKMLYAKESFMKNLDDKIMLQNEKNFEMRNIDMNYNLFIGYAKTIFEI